MLERELGRGGMATVYLARDVRHDRPVALKVLRPELAHAVGHERFLLEIRLAAGLDHPNILSVHDSGETAGRLWFTMPYVEGESLRQRLVREPQLPLAEALRITRAVADALGFAHGQRIIHRDVKPENILLQGERCRLADFGVARAVDAAGERLTETGLSIGTPGYMSPEQATADRHLDARSDIYSLGCVVYEMLAGELPFTGRTGKAIIARKLTESLPSLRVVRDVPQPVELAVRQALAREPADRFADAPAFAQALEAGASESATPASSARPAARRGPLAAALVSLLALAGVVLWLLTRTGTPDSTDANLLAVAPFEVLDPSLEVWREGMGDVLSRTLDGAGPIRTVSPSVVLRRWNGRADRASAEELGRRTGAGLILYGAVEPRGRDSVALRAAVLDRTGGSGTTDVEVMGEAARIGELADSLGIRALRVLSSGRAIGSVRRTSIGSRSLPALKAFLQGEQFFRRALWDSALTRYDQAIAADSTFALALYRMAVVLGWGPPTEGAYGQRDGYMRRATLQNQGLPPRDSLAIVADSFRLAAEDAAEPEAWVRLSMSALAAAEAAALRYPEDAMRWYDLGEWRLHDWYSASPTGPLEAFSRAIALDPGFAPSWEHMLELQVKLGRTEEARRSAATYLALYPASPERSHTRLAALLLDPGAAGRVEAERMLDTATVLTIWRAAIDQEIIYWPDTAETAIQVLRRLGDPGRSLGRGVDLRVGDSMLWPRYLAYALAFRGHLREAIAVDDRLLLRQPSASFFNWFLDPLLDLSLLGIVPDSIARATFALSLDPGASWGSFDTPRHLRGLPWWLSRGDTAALAHLGALAARVARTPPTGRVGVRARLLGEMSHAFHDLVRGDSSAAIRKLGAIPDTLCLADNLAQNCFHLNLTLARLLAARGEDRRAGELLDRWRWNAGATPSFVLATLELARIAERLGDTRKAAECYSFVTAAWRRADPELQPYAAEAKAGLARLGRE